MNKYHSHIYVLCEDDANRQIANGFLLDPSLDSRAIQVLDSAGGWGHVLKDFQNKYYNQMLAQRLRYMVFVIDFDVIVFDGVDSDEFKDRMAKVKAVIPEILTDRVFVLGALKEPEDLTRAKLGTLEQIGLSLAKDCRENTTITWSHP